MGTVVVSGLISKRSELAGQIQAAQHQIDTWQSALRHLDATIKLFAPETNLRAIRAKRQRKRNTYFGHGELNRLVLETLRDATAPMSCREIAEHLIATNKIASNENTVAVIQKTVGVVVMRLLQSRMAKRSQGDDGVTLWLRAR